MASKKESVTEFGTPSAQGLVDRAMVQVLPEKYQAPVSFVLTESLNELIHSDVICDILADAFLGCPKIPVVGKL